MDKKFTVQRPVKMDGPRNFRDLGGYPAKKGMTKKGVFYRSDGLQLLSDQDRQWILAHDIRCIIDLRNENEAIRQPDALGKDFTYYNIPMSDKKAEIDGREIYPDSLSELYKLILTRHMKDFVRVMRIFIEQNGLPLVFHCAVGKDRTGLTAMLLLSVCGVSEEVTLADYETSAQNMEPLYNKMKEEFQSRNVEVPDDLLTSPAEEMKKAMDFLHKFWGSAEGYLKAGGLTENELSRLRELFIESI